LSLRVSGARRYRAQQKAKDQQRCSQEAHVDIDALISPKFELFYQFIFRRAPDRVISENPMSHGVLSQLRIRSLRGKLSGSALELWIPPFPQKPGADEARRRRISFTDLRLRSNEAVARFLRKSSSLRAQNQKSPHRRCP
jgi:hypothetical protein